MEGEPDNKKRITKTEKLPKRITKELEQSKNIDRYSKRSHKEIVWQEKKEPTRIEDWRQHVVGSQKYPFKVILKEAGPKEIWTL